MGLKCVIFNNVEHLTVGNMDLCINDNHVLYYYMDTVKLTMLGHSYFKLLTFWLSICGAYLCSYCEPL